MMANRKAYERAKERAEAKLRFYVHLGSYLVANTVLVIVNLRNSTERLWFKWPLMGWGIGVGFHALGVFVLSGHKAAFTGRMIDRELERGALKHR